MVRAGVASEPWHMTFVFFRLMLRLRSLHALDREPGERVLELFFTVCDKCRIVGEEKVAEHNFANFVVCPKACRVEQLSVRSST